ncbi:phage head-tail connector protein [Staphylococcus aureus]
MKEVAVKRYNRIGAEGMTSEAVDGRSNAYELNLSLIHISEPTL